MSPFSTASLLASDPLALAGTDYARAELTVVYHRREQSRTLLLAVLEFLTPWMEPAAEAPTEPEHEDQSSFCKLGGSNNEINLRRVILSVSEAVTWYSQCRAGHVTLPPTAASKRRSPRRLLASSFEEEPPWPAVSLVDSAERPFWGARTGGHRHHQLFAATPPPLESWTTNVGEQETARSWLRDTLHIDLFETPLLWGSAHLLLTNPLFGHVHVHSPEARPDTLLIELLRHPGAVTSNIEFAFSEMRAGGPTKLAHGPLTSPTMQLFLGHEVLDAALSLNCPDRGLLYVGSIGPTVRSLHFDFRTITGVREVRVPARTPGEPDVYRTTLSGPPHTMHVGNLAPRPTIAARLFAESRRAERRRLAHHLGQRVFRGKLPEATEIVRALLAQAQDSVLILDPYFSAHDLGRYVLANGNHQVSFRIVTSKMSASSTDEEKIDRLEELHEESLRIQHSTTSPVDLRVNPSKSVFHDRYLAIDEAVWLLGSSLNKYGDRLTTMIELPDSEALSETLNYEWDIAQPLGDFLAKRRAVREASKQTGLRAVLKPIAESLAKRLHRFAKGGSQDKP